MSAAMGWVDGSWSWRYAQALYSWANVVHADVQRVASASAQRARPGGEGLVQPEVVPPAHRDQVAEPHVRHLVQDRLGAGLAGEVGDPGPEDVALQEGHAARVLHRAFLELGHEELVVLPERVPHAERRMIEAEALLGDLEDLLRIQVLGQRLTAVDPERDVLEGVAHDVIRTGRDRRDVGRHDRGRREVPPRGGLTGGPPLLGRHVGHDLPAVRRGDGQFVGRLQVGLVEASVDPVRVEGLQVGVHVHAAVGGVGEPVQALAAARVRAFRDHPELVLSGQASERDPVPVENVHADRHPVEGDLAHLRRGQVDERPRPGCIAAERHHGDRRERGLAAGQVQLDPV